jgi:hypothetical protein
MSNWTHTEFLRKKFTNAVMKGKALSKNWFVIEGDDLFVQFDGFRVYRNKLTLMHKGEEIMSVDFPLDLAELHSNASITLDCSENIRGCVRMVTR